MSHCEALAENEGVAAATAGGRFQALAGNEAVAEAMRQIDPDVVAAYPITPRPPRSRNSRILWLTGWSVPSLSRWRASTAP